MSSNLYRRDILKYLRYGSPPGLSAEEAFYGTISSEIDSIALRYGCDVELTEIDLLQAQFEWDGDLGKLQVEESEEPDHLKHAGWLCHWLRKKRPIRKLNIRDEARIERYFEDYYNECTAFIIGLKISIFHECCERGMTDVEIVETLDGFDYEEIIHDVSVFLNHKAVSPHAIYMIYKSLLHRSPLC